MSPAAYPFTRVRRHLRPPPWLKPKCACVCPRRMTPGASADLVQLDARLVATRLALDRILQEADACIAGLDRKRRLARRVRTAARRRRHAAPGTWGMAAPATGAASA